MITLGAVFLIPKFLPRRVIDCEDTMGRLGGQRAVTTGTLKLTRLKPKDIPDWAETTTFKAPPDPAGDLPIIALDEIQKEERIEVCRNKTFKDISCRGNLLPNKVINSAPVKGLELWSAALTCAK